MSRALVANPRRRKRRRNAGRRTSLATVTNKRRRRRNPRVIRNPVSVRGVVGTAKQAALPMGAGAVAGAISGFLDAKMFAKKPTTAIIAKVGLGVLGALVLRKKPLIAMGFAGGAFGSLGYAFGVKMGGGLVAHSPMAAALGLGELADADPAVAAMLADLGDVVDDSMGDAGEDYQAALGDVVSDDMGDIVDAY